MSNAARKLDPKRRYTVEEYLAFEEQSEEKHEYVDGEIIAMAGSTVDHAVITANMTAVMNRLLRGKPCRVYSSDLKVRPKSRARFRYPEMSVICGPVEHDPASKSKHVALNPTLLVEVLSPSTQRTDRTEKWFDYVLIPSFKEYVLVSQDEPRVETIFRTADGTWTLDHALGVDKTIKLQSLDIELPLGEVFEGVQFPETESDNEESTEEGKDK